MNYDEEKILTLFGERLKQLRKEKGLRPLQNNI